MMTECEDIDRDEKASAFCADTLNDDIGSTTLHQMRRINVWLQLMKKKTMFKNKDL